MKIKGIYGILFIAALVGAGVCWYCSDYSKHWRLWEAGIWVGGLSAAYLFARLCMMTFGTAKKPD